VVSGWANVAKERMSKQNVSKCFMKSYLWQIYLIGVCGKRTFFS